LGAVGATCSTASGCQIGCHFPRFPLGFVAHVLIAQPTVPLGHHVGRVT
jgi:hypothetical protein